MPEVLQPTRAEVALSQATQLLDGILECEERGLFDATPDDSDTTARFKREMRALADTVRWPA